MATAAEEPEEMDVGESTTDGGADGNAEKDEFIVDVNKVPLIVEVQDKLNDIFQVTFTFSDLCQDADVGNKQWVEIEGRDVDRRAAKEYIRALCNPVEVQPMRYPEELEVILTSAHVCDRVEKQSRAVLRFEQPGEVLIFGNDRLSVTLAYSALEDVISEHLDITSSMDENVIPMKRAGASRLDEELKRRLSTENGNTLDDDLPSLSNAIKRTILDVLNTDNKLSNDANLEMYGIQPHSRVDRAQAAKSSHSFIDIRSPKIDSRGAGTGLSLGDAAKQLKQIQLDSDESNTSGNNNHKANIPSETNADVSEEGKYLKNFALEKGYSEEQIEQVFTKHGRGVSFEDFYRSLNDIEPHTNKPSTSATVSQVENPTPPEKLEKQEKNLSSKQVASYIARLSKDHEEEDEVENIQELKLRNYQRQRLLMDIFEKRKVNQETEEEPAIESESSRETSEEPMIDLTGDEPDAPYENHPHDRNYHQKPQTNLLNYHRKPSKGHSKGNHRSRSPQHDSSRSAYVHGRSPSPKRLRAIQANRSPVQQHAPPSRNLPDYQNTTTAVPSHAPRNNLRYIIIDGSNLAMSHGNGKVYSCRGIQLCIEYFLKRGHTEVTAFVPQWRTRTSNPDHPISDQHLLDELKQQGHLVFTPARRVPGKNIVPYDDRYVIRLSEETDGVIVSNDNYRDLWHENREWRHIIENRLLMYSFVGDIFMPPDDPLGKDGPTLSQLLTKGDWRLPAGANVHTRINYNRPQYQQQQQQQQYSHQHQQQYYHRPQQPQQQFRPFQQMDMPRPKNNAWRQGNPNSRQHFQGSNSNQQTGFNAGYHQGFRENHGFHQSHGARAQRMDYVDHSTSDPQAGSTPSQDSVDGAGWQKIPRRKHRSEESDAPKREPVITEQLLQQMKNVFDNDDAIQTILMENPSETDLNILSEYYLNYTDSN